MYVYYRIMKIYVFVYTNILSSFYFLCTINMPHHVPIMDFTHTNYGKFFKAKILIPITIVFYKTLHSYNNLFYSNENISKAHKHSLIY